MNVSLDFHAFSFGTRFRICWAIIWRKFARIEMHKVGPAPLLVSARPPGLQ